MEKDLNCKNSIPPDFKLESLTVYDINTLSTDKKVSAEQAFILVAATAYNDLKDYYWLYLQLSNNTPSNPENIDPQTGQWNGMVIFCFRNIIATFFEFLEFINENKKILDSDNIKNTELLMGNSYSIAWSNIKRLATESSTQLTKDELAVYYSIRRIRHNITSHYYDTKNFGRGFEEYLKKDNPKVYASLGKSMEGTRFFFADAAVQSTFDAILNEHKVKIIDVLNFISKMNAALRSFVDCYLKISSKEIKMNRATKRSFKAKRKV